MKIAFGILGGFWLILLTYAFLMSPLAAKCNTQENTPISQVTADCYSFFSPL